MRVPFDISQNFIAYLGKTRYQTIEDFERVGERLRSAVRADRIVIQEPDSKTISLRFIFGNPLADTAEILGNYRESIESPHRFDFLPFGTDELGNPVALNFYTLPHALLAGMTGSGKSVGLNALMGAMATASEHVNFHLCDPKAVELKPWSPLASEFGHSKDEMLAIVQNVRALMMKRLADFESRGVRSVEKMSVEDVNAVGGIHVLVVDELSEFLLQCGKEGGEAISSIAQMGRALGVFLVTATQNPKSELFGKPNGTTTLRSNLSNLVAFRVGRSTDSDVILGVGEASGGKDASMIPAGSAYAGTAFLGHADDLFRVPYLSDDDIRDMVKEIAATREGDK